MNKQEKLYIDDLMRNHPLESDDSSDYDDSDQYHRKFKYNKKQYGGATSSSNIPNGGFPPLYICDKQDKEDIENKNREYSKHKNAISIKQIMEKRRNITPFVLNQ